MDKEKIRERLRKKYCPELVTFLGVMSDRDLGEMFNIDHTIITRARKKLGIAPFTKTFPHLDKNKRPRVVVTFADEKELMEISDLEAGALFHAALSELRKRKGA